MLLVRQTQLVRLLQDMLGKFLAMDEREVAW